MLTALLTGAVGVGGACVILALYTQTIISTCSLFSCWREELQDCLMTACDLIWVLTMPPLSELSRSLW